MFRPAKDKIFVADGLSAGGGGCSSAFSDARQAFGRSLRKLNKIQQETVSETKTHKQGKRTAIRSFSTVRPSIADGERCKQNDQQDNVAAAFFCDQLLPVRR